jgi:competence protein ComEC
LSFFFAGIVLSTLIANAAVAPFAAYHFHKSQQYAVISNLIALPVCNVIVMPAALIAWPFGLEAPPLWVMGWGIEAMVWVAHRVAEIPGAALVCRPCRASPLSS